MFETSTFRNVFWKWQTLFGVAAFILILFLTLQIPAHGAEPTNDKIICVPDKDGSVYLVPANDPELLKAVKDKIAGKISTTTPKEGVTSSALDEVNTLRASKGLRAFIFDPLLTQGAEDCSKFRAANLIAGHTRSDFSFLPTGARANAAGCAAWEPSMGWGSCCIYDNATYAGAGWSLGKDGKRYMHLFIR